MSRKYSLTELLGIVTMISDPAELATRLQKLASAEAAVDAKNCEVK